MRFFKNKLGTGFELIEPDTIYIHVPRHHGRTYTLMNHIANLMRRGKRVKIVDYNRVRELGGVFKPVVLDLDFIGNNPNSIWNREYVGDWIFKEPPVVKTNASTDSLYPRSTLPPWCMCDPSYTIKPDGSIRIKEISIVRKEE